MINYNIKNIIHTHFKINSIIIIIVFLLDFLFMFLGLKIFNSKPFDEYNKIYANHFYLISTYITIILAFMKKEQIEIYLNSSCSRKDINIALTIINLILSAFLLIFHTLAWILIIAFNSNDLNPAYIFMDNLKSLSILIAIIVLLSNSINYMMSILSIRNPKLEKYFFGAFLIIITLSNYLMVMPINKFLIYIYDYTDMPISFALIFFSFVTLYFIGDIFTKKIDL